MRHFKLFVVHLEMTENIWKRNKTSIITDGNTFARSFYLMRQQVANKENIFTESTLYSVSEGFPATVQEVFSFEQWL